MKSFFSLLFLFPLLLYGQVSLSLANNVVGKVHKSDLLLSLTQDLRLKGGRDYPWAGSLFLELQPPKSDELLIPDHDYGLSLVLPHLSAGRLTLSGSYDRLESPYFPSFYSWEKKPILLAEKGLIFNEHYGAALHGKDKKIIIHYLDNPDYRQAGAAFILEGDSFPLSFETVGVVTLLEGEEDDDESWYDRDKPIRKDELVHLQGRLNYEIPQSDCLWQFSLEGAALLPRLSKRGKQIMLSLSYDDNNLNLLLLGGFHEGTWLSCRGEASRWERGGGINFTLFKKKAAAIKGSALFFTLPGQRWESQDRISYEWEGGIKSDWFEFSLWQDYDGRYDQFRQRIKGKGGFYFEGGSLEGKGRWDHDDIWQQTLCLKGIIGEGGEENSFILHSSIELMHRNISYPFEYVIEGELGTSISLFNHWKGECSLVLPIFQNKSWGEGALLTGEISCKY